MKRILLTTAGALLCCLTAAAADFNGDGTGDVAIFRPSSGLWAVRGVTRFYFGGSGDLPVPGDYNGSGIDTPAIFRQNSGLWAIRGVTRAYFGGVTDQPKPGDYNADGTTDIGIFRPSSGLWAVRGVTRFYFGGSTDIVLDPGPPRGRSGGLLKTGQTIKSPGVGPNYEDDGSRQDGVAFSYHTELRQWGAGYADVVTIDHVTGLMWASDGAGYGCYDGDSLNWATAAVYVNGLNIDNFAGHSDWRIPNLRELESIRYIGWNPMVKHEYFPNTWGGWYWTSSNPFGVGTQKYRLNFLDGSVDYPPMSSPPDATYLRVVRSGN